jgi:hypothetical protein
MEVKIPSIVRGAARPLRLSAQLTERQEEPGANSHCPKLAGWQVSAYRMGAYNAVLPDRVEKPGPRYVLGFNSASEDFWQSRLVRALWQKASGSGPERAQ